MNKISFYSQTIPFLLVFILGIILQYLFPFSFISLLIGVFSLLSIYSYLPTASETILREWILVLSFLTGACTLEISNQKHNYIEEMVLGSPTTIIARINKKNTGENQWKEELFLEIIHIAKKEHSLYLPSRYYLAYHLRTNCLLDVGDMITLNEITIPRLKNKGAKTIFRVEDYLRKERIIAHIFCQDLSFENKITPFFSFNRILHHTSKKLIERIQSKLSHESFLLFSSIFWGNKKQLKKLTCRPYFDFWGISHYLARSGLHLTILIMLLNFLLIIIPLRFTLKQSILLFFFALYSLLSISSISFLRALFVFLASSLGILWLRKIDTLYVLGVICIFTLLFNPHHLFFIDFQLSFLLTAGLIWFNRILNTHS